MMAFHICLVGCGYMSLQGHGPMLAKYVRTRPWAQLAACCDISRERAERFTAQFGFRRPFTDMVQMIDEIRPDGIVLAVPAEMTAEFALAIVGRGIPLLTEKPPGISMAQGRAIASAVKTAGVPVSVAFNRRTMPLVETLAAQMDSLGLEMHSVAVEMCRAGRTEADFAMTAIHGVDLARYLCRSDYDGIRFLYREHETARPAADILALGSMASGAAVSLAFHPMCGMVCERVTVRLEEHTLTAELPVYGSVDLPGRIVHHTGNRVMGVTQGEPCDDPAEANGFLGEYISFFDAIREGRTPRHAVEDTLQSLDVACCISQRLPAYLKT